MSCSMSAYAPVTGDRIRAHDIPAAASAGKKPKRPHMTIVHPSHTACPNAYTARTKRNGATNPDRSQHIHGRDFVGGQSPSAGVSSKAVTTQSAQAAGRAAHVPQSMSIRYLLHLVIETVGHP